MAEGDEMFLTIGEYVVRNHGKEGTNSDFHISFLSS
jgi:hypothetical protein